MTRLILTADASAAGGLEEAGLADIAIPIEQRFVWGPPPSDAELAAFLAARTTQRPGLHWLDTVSSARVEAIGKDFGLIELCQRCETVELWMETHPNAQLVLIWLLDYFVSHEVASKLVLRHADAFLGDATRSRSRDDASMRSTSQAITSIPQRYRRRISR